MSNDALSSLAEQLEKLSADEQKEVLNHLDRMTSRDFMAEQGARKIAELKLRQQIAPLEAQLAEAMKRPSANAATIRALKKQLDPLWREAEALSK